MISSAFLHGQRNALAEAVAGSLAEGNVGRVRAAYRALATKMGGDYRAANAWLRDHCGIVEYARLGQPGGRPERTQSPAPWPQWSKGCPSIP